MRHYAGGSCSTSTQQLDSNPIEACIGLQQQGVPKATGLVHVDELLHDHSSHSSLWSTTQGEQDYCQRASCITRLSRRRSHVALTSAIATLVESLVIACNTDRQAAARTLKALTSETYALPSPWLPLCTPAFAPLLDRPGRLSSTRRAGSAPRAGC
jgi:hypothetical protein